jgi:hypothetical protein
MRRMKRLTLLSVLLIAIGLIMGCSSGGGNNSCNKENVIEEPCYDEIVYDQCLESDIPQYETITNLLGPITDWRAQDYSENLGITGVSYDQALDRLVLDCDLMGNDPAGGLKDDRGEILLDLKHFSALESSVPVDMTGMTITVVADIPPGFVNSSFNNGAQVFVKDNNDPTQSQYGTWVDCDNSGAATISLQPSPVTPPGGYTDPGFDPSSIRTVGVKFAINDSSDHQFNGQISINSIEVTPSLPFSSLPELPQCAPMPFATTENEVTMESDGFYIGCNQWFVIGGNWQMLEYGQNFGSTAWYPNGNGASKHPGYISVKLALFRQAGITLLRVGLLEDGRTMFDEDGNVTGYDQAFRDDVTNLLDLAAQNNMKIEFIFVDYTLAGKEEAVNGVWVRGRREVIEDEGTRALFLTDFLEPFLREFGGHPALFGFDVINEPEWIVSKSDGGGWEDVTDADKAVTPVNGDQFRSFVSECIGKIHELAPGKFVTAGVSLTFVDLIKDFDLDYYAFHYYPWMGTLEDSLTNIPGDKLWSLEEFPGKGNLTDYLNAVKQAGGAGALLWNLSPEIDVNECYTFEEEESKLREISSFANGLTASSR